MAAPAHRAAAGKAAKAAKPHQGAARRDDTDGDERRETLDAFKQAVNMTPAKLERWLDSDESKSVGWTHEGEHESVGHHSGRRIVELLRTKQPDLSADDLGHMRKVVGYVHRHMAQRPDSDVSETRWRYSLMNWGHDPLARH